MPVICLPTFGDGSQEWRKNLPQFIKEKFYKLDVLVFFMDKNSIDPVTCVSFKFQAEKLATELKYYAGFNAPPTSSY